MDKVMPRWLFKEVMCCLAVGSAVNKTASSCQLQGVPQLQRVAPPNVMPLPGQPILGDQVRCAYKDPATWALYGTPLMGHTHSRTPSQVSQGIVKPALKLDSPLCPVLIFPLPFVGVVPK